MDSDFLFNILLPALLNGLIITLQLILLAAPFGLTFGILIAVGRVYGGKSINLLCRLFVGFVKGCPLILLLFILYFGLPSVGIYLSAFMASIIGFICCNSAYNSEYIRGAILSVKEGQLVAASALGMTKRQAIIHIVLPQALRRAIPGLSNEFIYLIKYSSLAYMITLIELTGAGKLVFSKYFEPDVFLMIGVIYLALVTITTFCASMLEKKYAVPGTAQR
ncbi:amino acid ABC transporter permease [Methanoplanus sp. FWC-SCC4]|uniref:Amino acid ABC transporter permease n=1 Tax=Methanochimaera problematica TaxID=2609417 RepID=A0AA97FF12_9EURY|nr:amino acid ABC transporter permease [Methanoplanus sp. FWC-SCC4]WOF16838.1 amino acid ABC transporter permease [Methanoplanus sp. FWC-SCC4]